MDMVMLDKADLMSSESYQKVLQIYFINLSAFRRFIVNARTQKEINHKIKSYLTKCNQLYKLNRSSIELQADKIALLQLAFTLNNDLAA